MNYLFDQKKAEKELNKFFINNKRNINTFGSRVNQTFEAYVFAKTIKYYKDHSWNMQMINPKNSNHLRLKFSTRGAPINFSYCRGEKNNYTIQIRHQLRVDILKKYNRQTKPSNICCDIVIMEDENIDSYNTSDSLPNDRLISFGEIKHMSAFAELVASFIGLVHELSPNKLKRIRRGNYTKEHLAPFLYVSGLLFSTAGGIKESLVIRKYDIDIYSYENPL